MTNISTYKKLHNVQKELNVPKKHQSPDGEYKYFKLGDIYKALEPLAEKFNFMCYTGDENIVSVGNKLYIKSTVFFVDLDLDKDNIITASALARECTYNNGMAESQQTGSATTYARKNSYNALFKLEDEENVDPDTQPNGKTDVILDVEHIPTTEEAAATTVAYKPTVKIKNKSLLGKTLGTLPYNTIVSIATSKKVTEEVAKAAEVLLNAG